jgi:hypothetical protein
MNVRGHSGFVLQLLNERLIRKSSDRAGAARLKRQIEKQIRFSSECATAQIKIPQVVAVHENDESFAADMEFIAARDFVQFLTRAGRKQLDDFLAKISRFIFDNLANSHDCDVRDAVCQKLDELSDKDIPINYLNIARNLADRAIVIPCGPCHGDLTLSNILFKGEAIYLLDFLDSFVESPLQDIVKLRQDTQFKWSLAMYTLPFDRTKLHVAMEYLDRAIDNAFSELTWYKSNYPLFQLINLLRILPYCKDSQARQNVCSHVEQLLASLPDSIVKGNVYQ